MQPLNIRAVVIRTLIPRTVFLIIGLREFADLHFTLELVIPSIAPRLRILTPRFMASYMWVETIGVRTVNDLKKQLAFNKKAQKLVLLRFMPFVGQVHWMPK